jgi:hypothetical protein
MAMAPIWRKAWVRSARLSTLGVVLVGAAGLALEWSTLAELALEAEDDGRLEEDDALVVEEGLGVGVEVVVGL